MSTKRALHFVFKVGNRPLTMKFFKDVLGMKVLRHEEFDEESCNAPYDGKWSKTMIGYGPEDNYFVVELTYKYGVSSYELGNDFMGITIQSNEIIENAKLHNWPTTIQNDLYVLEAPGGYKFHILDKPKPADTDPVMKVTLACEDLKRSINYWNNLCGMKIYSQNDDSCILGYADTQAKLELWCINKPVDHAKAFGRIAFSCPSAQLAVIEKTMKDDGRTILTPLLSLDTPGEVRLFHCKTPFSNKSSIDGNFKMGLNMTDFILHAQASRDYLIDSNCENSIEASTLILADPDGHEICFVGDEAFRELSRVDPEGDALLQKAMGEDKSDEWFAGKGLAKAEG